MDDGLELQRGGLKDCDGEAEAKMNGPVSRAGERERIQRSANITFTVGRHLARRAEHHRSNTNILLLIYKQILPYLAFRIFQRGFLTCREIFKGSEKYFTVSRNCI